MSPARLMISKVNSGPVWVQSDPNPICHCQDLEMHHSTESMVLNLAVMNFLFA